MDIAIFDISIDMTHMTNDGDEVRLVIKLNQFVI